VPDKVQSFLFFYYLQFIYIGAVPKPFIAHCILIVLYAIAGNNVVNRTFSCNVIKHVENMRAGT